MFLSSKMGISNTLFPGQPGTANGCEWHMYTFEKPVSCDYYKCGRLLKGLFYQGYRWAKSRNLA